jgi:DNA-binding winged helix-turn-helix (wHTH) protein
MQVLVALRQAEGSVVSRDELIARCWDSRIT